MRAKEGGSAPRGRWDGALSPLTPGVMPEVPPLVTLPKLPGGGGIFKCAAVAVLREENRLMSTGEIARLALARGYVRCQGKTPEATMASALYTDLKKKGNNSVFNRPEEGLFGLREWSEPGKSQSPLPPKADKPPMAPVRPETEKLAPPLPPKISRKRRSSYTGTDSLPWVAPVAGQASPRATKPPKAVSKPPVKSVDENLLLLLDAAQELEAEEPPLPELQKGARPESSKPIKKRRWTEPGNSMDIPIPQPRRETPIIRPQPLQIPLTISLNANGQKLITPVPSPPTPTMGPMEVMAAGRPSDSPEQFLPQAATGDAGLAARLAASTKPVDMDDSPEASTSSDTSAMEESGQEVLAASQQFPFTDGSEPLQPRLLQMGQMLAAREFAARLLHADALITQMEQMFGPGHPLVGKALITKARICQMEGSPLSLIEAEQTIMRASEILFANPVDMQQAEPEVHSLLNHVRGATEHVPVAP